MIEIENKQTGEIVSYTEDEFVEARNLLLRKWETAKEALAAAKEIEMEFRKAAVDFSFNQDKTKGTERIELGNGYQAKAVKKENYGFVKDDDGKLDKSAIDCALLAIETDGDVGELIAERLVKWTPSLSMSEYKLLSNNHKRIIDRVIVITSGAPTLEIVKPKAKK